MKAQLNATISKALDDLGKLPPEKAQDADATKAVIAQKRQELTNLERVKGEREIDAWCADYTEGLAGDVGLIEIAGAAENGIVIQPGYQGNAQYDAKRDGILHNSNGIPYIAWFWNLIVGFAWQKWRAPYRAATILDVHGNAATIRTELVVDKWLEIFGRKEQAQIDSSRYADVPIRYMDCNGQAFEVGDRVIVRMAENRPIEIIGFAANPKPCDVRVIVFAVFMSDGAHGLEAGRRYVGRYIDGVLTQAYDINGFTGAPKDGFLRVAAGTSETNSVSVFCYWRSGEANGEPIYTPMAIRIPIDWNQWETAYLQSAVNNGDPRYSGGNQAGYRLEIATIGWAYPTSLIGMLQRQEIGHNDYQVIASTWNDLNGNHTIDIGEVYPADYKQHCYMPIGITASRDRVIMGLWAGYDGATPYYPCDSENEVTCKIMAFNAPHYSDSLFYWGATPSYDTHKLADLMTLGGWNDIDGIEQLQAIDGILYVSRRDPATLTAYDMDDGMAAVGFRAFQGWDRLGTISVIRWRPDVPGDEYRLSVMPYNSGSDRGPMYVLGWVTLDVKATINFQGHDDGSIASAVGVRAYAQNVALRVINAYRTKNGVGAIAYSGALADITRKHLTWLNSVGAVKHEDAQGRDSILRFRNYGFWGVGENLALVEAGTEEEMIDRAIALWDISPHHKENLLDMESVAFGYGVIHLDNKWRTITYGPGRYMPETGQYTTEDTTWDIPEEYIGKLAIVGFNPARY